MSNVSSPARRVKSNKPARTLSVLERLPAGALLVAITERKTERYVVRPLSCDWGACACSWTKLPQDGGDGTGYDVSLGGPGEVHTCECAYALSGRASKACRHVAATAKLHERGEL